MLTELVKMYINGNCNLNITLKINGGNSASCFRPKKKKIQVIIKITKIKIIKTKINIVLVS